MSTKEQEELEQPVKGYQLKEVSDDLKDLKDFTKAGFDELKTTLTEILAQTRGLVTQKQLDDHCKEAEASVDKKIKELEKKISLKYDPMKNQLRWASRAIVMAMITIVAELVMRFVIK